MKKACKECRAVKPATDFYGGQGECKECTKARVRAYRMANIDRIREYDRQRGQDQKRKARNRKNYYKRVSTQEGRAREWQKRKKYLNPTKRAAQVIFGNAIRDGRAKRGGECKRCGATKYLHGHHEDYFKPLEVVWLCRACHGKRHREINAAIRSGEDWSDRGF